MTINQDPGFINRVPGGLAIGGSATLAFLVLSVVTASVAGDRPELWKLLGIGWAAFFAMAGAAPLGARAATRDRPKTVVWGYGLASGAMVTSAAVFLVPSAIDHHVQFGGFGVAAGLIAGYAAHTVGHRLSHVEAFDHTAVELSAHALAAGAIIGIVYGNMPDLGVLLGLAIVSHKAPAGYAAARRLAAAGRSPAVLLLPASGVGITGLLAGLVALPSDPVISGVVFGFAAGVFLHVGMDFLPECEVGGEIHAMTEHDHEDHEDHEAHRLLDRLRMHAVGATAFGGAVVFLAWLVVSGNVGVPFP